MQDGASQTTTLTNYYRGVPKKITYADTTFQEAGVNAFGQIEWVKNERGDTTNYDYRADGRLWKIRYPVGDTTTWNDTVLSFAPTTDGNLGVGGTHWRQTITTGTGRKTTEFDALWRPVVTLEEDTSNASTKRYVTRTFDHAGRETFTSYPSASAGTAGTWTTYDGLGRPTKIEATSELVPSLLTTQIAYDSGFTKTVTNPRGFSTTTSFKAFDTPSEDWPVEIDDPVGLTSIARDAFGKPLSMSRSGSYTYPGTATPLSVSTTRSYVYDTAQRLCKTVEPESGATILAYDLADNVAWSASGQSLTGTGSCNNTNPVAISGKANFSYDARNRLLVTDYDTPTTPDIVRSYTPDGLLETIASDGSTWTYVHNKRGLLESETLSMPGYGVASWTIGHVWNANGHAASLSYPDLGAVDYLPNGLGQPTKVGTFASGVTWHPNGAIAGFTYGNGIVHSQSQTTRGLPQVREDTGALQDHYAWDGNGNVAAITDQRIAPPQSRTRSMAYDGRDRLTSTGFPFAGSTFSYSYDPLDNLRTVSATGGRNHRLEYAANGRLTRLYDPASPGMDVIGYAYDARGNTTDRTSATGFVPDQSFVVDEANRVRSTSGRVVQGYAYDGHGRRTRTTTGSNTRVQVYARDGRLLLEDNAPRHPKLIKPVSYLYLGNRLLAQQHDDGSRKYVHTDVLGSVVAESTAAPPAITQRPMWEAYGAPWNGSFTHGPGYAGHAMDTATKLVYMQQRYHDPYAGRFLAVDPVAASAGSFNRYWYANNNPYRFTDPDGRLAKEGDRLLPIKPNSCQWLDCFQAGGGSRPRPPTNSGGRRAPGEVRSTQEAAERTTGVRLSDEISRLEPMRQRREFVGPPNGPQYNRITNEALSADLAAIRSERIAILQRVVVNGSLNLSNTAHSAFYGQRGYIPSHSVLDVISNGSRIPDPQGVAGQFMYRSPASRNASSGSLEVLIHEPSGQIRHIMYSSD